MGPLSTAPPPLRRIDAGGQPALVEPPAGAEAVAAAERSPAAGPLAGSRRRPAPSPGPRPVRMTVEDCRIAYGEREAVRGVSLEVRQGEVLALIGPSGCGKTSLLRALNRLVEITPGASRRGRITLDGADVDAMDVTELRRRVSMVFQQPNPFPMSVFDNVAFALREQGSKRPSRAELAPAVAEALRRAGLHGEVAGELERPALRLSGGQQQRLCIARALAARPEVLLLDEPCSALDPLSTATIEELILALRAEMAIVIVTHNLQQAWRVADEVAFMYLGDLVEQGPAERVFAEPARERTREYVSGGFG